jgi:hypothetical protein
MPLLIPTTKQGLKDAIFEALVRQSKVTSGDPVVSYARRPRKRVAIAPNQAGT